MNSRRFVSVLVAGALLSGAGACRSTRVPCIGPPITVPRVVSVWGNWTKVRRESFDVSLSIRNESPDDIVVLLHEIVAARGDAVGDVYYAAFGIGERFIDLVSGQTKTFTLVCSLRVAAPTAPVRVTL
ncbi:MAG: hypothetical protein FJ265_23180, partial [Planctomycetes bacterium]|nr:hypothetical protein [Planctomycetota bacterium]